MAWIYGEEFLTNLKYSLAKAGSGFLSLPWAPGLITAGLLLRWSGLSLGALWYDEVFSLEMTRQGFIEMIYALRGNLSPPGWEIILWFITRVFGWNAFTIRIIPFLASAAALWLSYCLMQRFYLTPTQQFGALAAITLNPLLLWMAHEGRVYSLFSLLYLLGILFSIQGRWVWLGIVMGIMLWLHNTAIIFIFTLLLLALITHPDNMRSVFTVGLLSLASWIPWIPIIISRTTAGIPFFVRLNFNGVVFSFFQVFLGFYPNNLAWRLVFFIFLITILWLIFEPWANWILFRMRAELSLGWRFFSLSSCKLINRYRLTNDLVRSIKLQNFLFLPAMMPFFLLILFSLFYFNVTYYKTLTPLIIPLILWLSMRLIPDRINFVNWIMPAAWSFVLIFGIFNWSPSFKGGNLLQYINLINKSWEQGDIIFHADSVTALPFWYYLPGKPQYVIDGNSHLDSDLEFTRSGIRMAPLDKIPHKRAWVIWWRDEEMGIPSESTNQRMDQSVRNCTYIGDIEGLVLAPAQVYICD